ncbi:hypothetical protein PanWU01x14_166840, partial [Parasponia andersonii]
HLYCSESELMDKKKKYSVECASSKGKSKKKEPKLGSYFLPEKSWCKCRVSSKSSLSDLELVETFLRPSQLVLLRNSELGFVGYQSFTLFCWSNCTLFIVASS